MSDDWIIGCDVGGTFTDLVAISGQGEVFYSKAPTTPHNLVEGIMGAIERVAKQAGLNSSTLLSNARLFSHGTTQTTNAIIQRRGAKTGLIITRGFKHTIEIMKAERGVGISESNRQHITRVRKQTPLVPLNLIKDVSERLDYNGEVLVPLDTRTVSAAVDALIDSGVDAIAVCLLWSFKNPAHERAILEIINKRAPSIRVDLSSDIAPIRGEYERCMTTVVNCFVSPVIENYLSRLGDVLHSNGFGHSPLIMTSMGGVVPAKDVARRGVDTLLSGPAGGIVMARHFGGLLGYNNIITADMGGTSFDVGLILNGKPVVGRTPLVPESDPFTSRYRILAPAIEIESIGAGGGSIAWIDRGVLNVGPQSAGAVPGPACYGAGGQRPTVTDADVVLGYINPDYFLGGSMPLKARLAEKSIEEHIAEPLGMNVVDSAGGIYDIINSNMADLIRKMTVERGYDPREFALFAFGGASPVHCGGFGKELGVVCTVVPSGLASVYSAMGIAMTDLCYSVVNADHSPLLDPVRMNKNFDDLETRASAMLGGWGVKPANIEIHRSVDMRYRRQVYDLNVPVPQKVLDESSMQTVRQGFEQLYEMNYGKGAAIKDAELDITNYRVDAIGRITAPAIRQRGKRKKTVLDEANRAPREAFFRGAEAMVETSVFNGELLDYGNMIDGPAIIEYVGTTLIIHPGQRAEVDPYLNVIVRAG